MRVAVRMVSESEAEIGGVSSARILRVFMETDKCLAGEMTVYWTLENVCEMAGWSFSPQSVEYRRVLRKMNYWLERGVIAVRQGTRPIEYGLSNSVREFTKFLCNHPELVGEMTSEISGVLRSKGV